MRGLGPPGLNFESCVWRAVSSHSSHYPQELLPAQFSLCVHKRGLKPDSFHLFMRVNKVPSSQIFRVEKSNQINWYRFISLIIAVNVLMATGSEFQRVVPATKNFVFSRGAIKSCLVTKGRSWFWWVSGIPLVSCICCSQ